MSLAWETTEDDIITVMSKHGVDIDTAQATRILSTINTGKIEKMALKAIEIEDQTQYAYCEIEDQLISMGKLTEKKWN